MDYLVQFWAHCQYFEKPAGPFTPGTRPRPVGWVRASEPEGKITMPTLETRYEGSLLQAPSEQQDKSFYMMVLG